MADLREDVKQEQDEEEQQTEQLVAAQDVGTMAHNEETEAPLHDSDSHNAADEQQAPEYLAAIENFGDETDSELVNAELEPEPESEQLQLQQKQREREELESSGDEDEDAATIEMSDTFNDEWSALEAEHVDAANDLNNHIDIYENFVPGDLSNDIAVNDIAAANPDFPHNPDAELIEVPAAVKAMPKFEKLSLTPMMK